MAGYARQSSSSIADGEVITAAPLNSEFDALLAAFAFSGGHNHDGTSTEGAYVGLIADVDALNKIVVDTSNNRHGFFVEVSSSAVEQIRIQDGAIVPVTDSDIDLGTSSLEFKDLYIDGTAYIDTLEVHVGATLSAGVLTLPDGSASAPVITNASDTNQGLYFSGTDEMSFTAGGTAQVTFADGAIKPVTDNDIDLGTSSLEFKNLYIDGTANIDTLAATTMSGDLAMGSNKVTGLAAPTADGDAARKVYVDDSIASAEGLTQLAGIINVNGYHFTGSSGENITFKPVGSASTVSTQDTDGEFVALVLKNESDAADTTGIASLRFDLEDTGGNAVDAAKIAVKKEQSFTATASTQDAKIVFSTSLNGTLTEYLALTSAGALLPVADNTVDIGSSSYELKDIYVDGTAYLDAIGFGTTSITLPTSDGSANQILKTNGSGTLSWADDSQLSGAVTSVTSMLNASLVIGRDADNDIDFGTDNTIIFRAEGADQVKITNGAILPVTDDDIDLGSGTAQFKDGYFDGTVEADAITVGGVTLAETIADTAGAMFSSNTETGVTVTYQDSDNTIDVEIDAAQTAITSLLATDIKIGEDDQTKIDFETADEIHFYAANVEQVYLADNIFGPQTDSDVDLGTTGVRWKDAYIDSVTVTDNVTVGGNLTVNGTTTTVNSTTVTIDDPIFTLGGDTAPGSDDNKDRGIEFRYHTGSAAKVGFFGYDDSASAFTFIADATNSSEVFSGTAGNVAFGDIAGTLTTAAQTNITSVGALDGGSITSGFGTIDTGSSNITTTGLISGGSLDIDDVLINGTTIGHTDDTDLMTLASGALTVAGTIEGTTITASTAVVPDASGGADLGSTSLEWGDLYIADDKKIYLGSDQNFSIEYDEDGNDTTAVVAANGVSFAPHGSSAGNGTELRFQELAANGANYVGFKAPDAIASNEVWVLPNADGSADQVLKTDGSNALAWVDQAGGGTVSLVADGAITAGKPVILTDAGKAKQIVEAASSTPSGVFNTMDDSDTSGDEVQTAYESNSGAYAMVYKDSSNSSYGTCVCGTWSDGTITWGTPVVFESSAIDDVPTITAGGNRIHVAYRASDTQGGIKSASISGTTPTFGSETLWGAVGSAGAEASKASDATGDIKYPSTVYDTTTDRFVSIFADDGNSGYGTAVVYKITDASTGAISVGTSVVFNSADSDNNSDSGKTICADPDTGRVVAVFRTSSTVKAVVGAVNSGTDVTTWGSVTAVAGTDNCQHPNIVYDPNVDRVLITYKNNTTANDPLEAIVGTVTGGTDNSIAFGTKAIVSDTDTNMSATAFDPDTNKILIAYDKRSSSDGASKVATITGGTDNTVAFGSEDIFEDAGVASYLSVAYHEGSNKFVVVYNDESDGHIGKAIVGSISGTDMTYGSSTTYNGDASGLHNAIYDSQAELVMVAHRTSSNGNIKVNALDATSGTNNNITDVYTITASTNNNDASGIGIAYDTDLKKTTIVYENANSDFRAATIHAQGHIQALGYALAYDTDNNYVVMHYSGAPKGSSTSFIRAISYNTGTAAYTGQGFAALHTSNSMRTRCDIIYDPDANRAVSLYIDGSNSEEVTANVIQLGGTAASPTVTIGSDVLLDSGDDGQNVALTYDTTNNKVFAAYENNDDGLWKGAIGTVTAGTNSISFAGTATIWNATASGNDYGEVVFDAVGEKIMFFYRDDDNSDALTYKTITPGASSFSVATGAVLSTSDNRFHAGSGCFGASKGVLLGTFDSGNSNKVSYATTRFPLSSNLDNGNYLGVAAESISDTATGKINIPGGVNENQTSLTIGNHYFTNGNGVVGLVGNNTGEQYLGKAIAADKIQLLENEGYLYGTADGAITAGKPVQVKSDGDFQMVSETTTSYSFAQGSSLALSVGTNFTGDIAYNTNTDKMCVAQIDSGTNKLIIHHGTVTGGTTNTVSWGSTDAKTSLSGTADNIKIAYDPISYKTFCGFYDGSNGEGFIFSNSSGTSSTVGTSSNFTTQDPYGVDVVNVGEDKWVVLYLQGSGYPQVRVVTASGTSVSYGTAVTVNSSSAISAITGSDAGIAMTYDTASSQVVVFYRNSSGDFYAKVGTISGTDISFGSQVGALNNGGNSHPHPGGATYVTGKDVHVVAFDRSSDGEVLAVKTSGSGTDATLVNNAGTAPGYAGNVVFDSQPILKPNVFTAYENVPVIVYSDDSVDINSIAVTVDGTTLTMGTDRTIETTTSHATIAGAYDPDTKRAVIIFRHTGNDIYYQVIAVEGSETSTNLATDGESYIGIATKTVADDAQAEVATFGQIDAQQSSLTAGQKYFVQSDGSLATSADSSVPGYTGTVTTVAGKALSATKLLISE